MKGHLLIFVPGIMGTELYYNGPGEFRGIVRDEPVWTEDLSVLWSTLRRNHNRLAMPTELTPGKVLRRLRVCPRINVEELYGPLFGFLARLGYVEDLDFIPFGYDWRQSNELSAERLATTVREKLASGWRQVRIIAHSMGGLVVRLLLLNPKNRDIAPAISTFVQIGSPIKGAPRALPTLKNRPQFGRICDLILRVADHVSPESYHELIQALNTFPSLFELLPHTSETAVLTRAGDQLTAHDMRLWPRVPVDTMAALHTLQERIRQWHGPGMACIYSTDLNTDAVYYSDERLTDFSLGLSARGDGTVIVASATDGAEDVQCHPISERVQHQDLPNHPTVWKMIEGALQ